MKLHLGAIQMICDILGVGGWVGGGSGPPNATGAHWVKAQI